jgi:dolichyl-phosphate-mannose-protein mannosyltransferase
MIRRDPFFGALALLTLLQAGFLAAHLVYPDLNLDYPFMDGDSHDWIANGLALAGHGVRSSGRAPLLPLTVAALDRTSALPWLPVLLTVLFHGTVLAFYTLAARLGSRRAAFAAALALLVNHALLGTSLQVMADVPASCLLFLGARSFLLAREEPRRYAGAGLLGGLSAVTQPIGVVAAVPAALTVVLRRRDHLRARSLWLGAALLAGLPILGAALQRATDGDIPASQLALVSLHAGSVPFYGRAFLSFLGWPACLLLVAGLVIALRERGDAALFTAALFAVLTGFFVFLYAWEAKRFLVYPVWMAGLLISAALSRLPRPLFGAAAVALVALSAMPLPADPQDPSWATLLHQVAAARPAPGPRLHPATFRQDRSALYLYERPSDGGGRYRTITRLGNALRKRVKYVPASWLEPWWSRVRVTRLGRITDDYAVYRAGLPGSGDTWLLVAPAASGIERRLDALAGGVPAPDSSGLAEARAIDAALAGWDGYVALIAVGRPEPWQLYLPFLVRTTELYVAQPGEVGQVLDLFAAAPDLGRQRVGTVVVRRAELLGRRASLVTGTAAPRR